MTVHQPDIFLSVVHWLPAANSEGSAFPRAKNRQRLQTPQSGSVHTTYSKGMHVW